MNFQAFGQTAHDYEIILRIDYSVISKFIFSYKNSEFTIAIIFIVSIILQSF